MITVSLTKSARSIRELVAVVDAATLDGWKLSNVEGREEDRPNMKFGSEIEGKPVAFELCCACGEKAETTVDVTACMPATDRNLRLKRVPVCKRCELK